MHKLIRPILYTLFILAFSYKGLAQQPVRMPVRRYVPVQRYNNQPNRVPNYNNQPNRVPNRPLNPAKNNPNSVRRMEVVKEGFLTRQMRLTPDESRSFWPLYRQYIQDQTAVRILIRQNSENKSLNGMQQTDNELRYQAELVNIRRHYRDEFLRILPPDKVSELYRSEREFNDEVIRQLSERSVRAGD